MQEQNEQQKVPFLVRRRELIMRDVRNRRQIIFNQTRQLLNGVNSIIQNQNQLSISQHQHQCVQISSKVKSNNKKNKQKNSSKQKCNHNINNNIANNSNNNTIIDDSNNNNNINIHHNHNSNNNQPQQVIQQQEYYKNFQFPQWLLINKTNLTPQNNPISQTNSNNDSIPQNNLTQHHLMTQTFSQSAIPISQSIIPNADYYYTFRPYNSERVFVHILRHKALIISMYGKVISTLKLSTHQYNHCLFQAYLLYQNSSPSINCNSINTIDQNNSSNACKYNRNSSNESITYNKEIRKILIISDILIWKQNPMTSSQFQFRLMWLVNNLNQSIINKLFINNHNHNNINHHNHNNINHHNHNNTYSKNKQWDVRLIKYWKVGDSLNIKQIWTNNLLQQPQHIYQKQRLGYLSDGILFYQKNSYYTHGVNPQVLLWRDPSTFKYQRYINKYNKKNTNKEEYQNEQVYCQYKLNQLTLSQQSTHHNNQQTLQSKQINHINEVINTNINTNSNININTNRKTDIKTNRNINTDNKDRNEMIVNKMQTNKDELLFYGILCCEKLIIYTLDDVPLIRMLQSQTQSLKHKYLHNKNNNYLHNKNNNYLHNKNNNYLHNKNNKYLHNKNCNNSNSNTHNSKCIVRITFDSMYQNNSSNTIQKPQPSTNVNIQPLRQHNHMQSIQHNYMQQPQYNYKQQHNYKQQQQKRYMNIQYPYKLINLRIISVHDINSRVPDSLTKIIWKYNTVNNQCVDINTLVQRIQQQINQLQQQTSIQSQSLIDYKRATMMDIQ